MTDGHAYRALVAADTQESLSKRTPPMFALDAILELQNLGYVQQGAGAWKPPNELVKRIEFDHALKKHVVDRIEARWPPGILLTNGDLLLQACALQTAVDEYQERTDRCDTH